MLTLEAKVKAISYITHTKTFTISAVIAQETLDGDIASDYGLTDYERGKKKKNKEALENYAESSDGAASAYTNGMNSGQYNKPKKPKTTKKTWTPKPYAFKSALGIKASIIFYKETCININLFIVLDLYSQSTWGLCK